MDKVYARRAGEIPLNQRDPNVDYTKYAKQLIYVDEAGKPITGDARDGRYDLSNVTYYKPSRVPSQESSQTIVTPEERYRQYDKAAMSNPANPYNAAKTWILSNAGLAGASTLSVPMFAVSSLGDMAGQYIGNRISDYVFNNPDKSIKINNDITITPRQFMQHGAGTLAGLGTYKGINTGTTIKVIGNGAENRVKSSFLSPVVIKESTVSPAEMHIRNNIPGYIRNTYLGKTEDGLNRYLQPKMFFPKSKLLYKLATNKLLKRGYQKITHPNLLGDAFVNKRLNTVISDLANYGEGQVGITLGGKVGFGDLAVETIPAFRLAMQKKGGKLGK